MIDQKLADNLRQKAKQGDSTLLRSVEFRALFDQIKTLPPEERGSYGREVNALRQELEELLRTSKDQTEKLPPIDVTAPFDINTDRNKLPKTLPGDLGTQHPLMSELSTVLDIFYRMGFTAVESREIDDDFHMFGSLNFPEDHPARDDYDTFMTTQTDKAGQPLIAPAHTSTMQNRILVKYKHNLEKGLPIAAVIPGRVFRNEDLDARHEHTFYQLEGVYVDKGINAGHLIATLKTFLQEYYGKQLEVRTNPYYFPFTEPSFEFMLSCPFCDKAGCSICSQAGWIELLGCGMIHPNVLHAAGIDTNVYTGFAWGGGIDRLVMMKYGIEDVRYFESGRLDFPEAVLMKIVDRISIEELKEMASKMHEALVKADVDLERGIVLVDMGMHADGEAQLLEDGSKQKDLWGINLHPGKYGTDGFVEFDSMINLRPSQGNYTRGIEDESVRKQIIELINGVVHE